jgi:hypothetical protein
MLFMRRFEGSTGGAWYHGFQILLRCMSPQLAPSVALNPFCQGLLIEGEADSNAAAR